jgi:hypothetical protein
MIKKFLAALCLVFIGANAYATSLSIDPFNGRINGPAGHDYSNMKIVISWDCYKPALNETGYKRCSGNKSGTVEIPINRDGSFAVPSIRSPRVWWASFPVSVRVVVDNSAILNVGDYSDQEFFVNPIPTSVIKEDLQNLTLIQLKGLIISTSIVATEGDKMISFRDVKEWYPQSYNQNAEVVLSLTYDMSPGVTRTRAWHSTYSFHWPAKMVGDSIVVSDSVWLVKGYRERTPITAEMKLTANIGLKSQSTEYRYVRREKIEKVEILSAAQLEVPQQLIESFETVVIPLDDERCTEPLTQSPSRSGNSQ